nr:hypothetical protein [Actinomycetales bacterium]
MDAITSYIDHMFRSLPQTHEVRRAKSELLEMSEDRYHELRTDGISENEAVGRVITQFGNLEELADGLGIRTEFDGVGDPAVAISAAEAEGYLRTSGRAATLIGSGVLIILAGLAVQILEGGSALGIGLLLVFVAAGVATFITAGMLMGQFSRLEDRVLHLDGATLARFEQQRESEQPRFMAHIVGGVVIIILGAGASAMGYIAETSTALETASSALGPLVIGVGVFLLIRGG